MQLLIKKNVLDNNHYTYSPKRMKAAQKSKEAWKKVYQEDMNFKLSVTAKVQRRFYKELGISEGEVNLAAAKLGPLQRAQIE